MVKFGLQIKANLENVTNLQPDGEDFRWYLKLKCLNCGEEPDHFQYLTLLESAPLKGGRGSASLVVKCRLCGRENSIDIIKESIASYTAEESDANKYKTITSFDCRGMEPTAFSPRAGFSCKGANSVTVFEVDLKENEWVDYDEKAKESVGIYEVESKFIKL
ncbi:CXXC motif containing zinc binding protein-like [Saccoglossus kowalevskii]|uniref:UPF0587 protein C1orf123 homolog n=1 Tax=Saccoglossus kowalevskii TaxID=10224 RepID=A0ABM0N0E7_SACKO|nr:PREDICTED: UPF0587 protein C1orf123 homolog [Saccoglossus kowalevskii]